jgi:purine-binding chemotaxis protein CheW
MKAAARESSDGAQWVLFGLDAGRYALPLENVERVVRAAAYTPLPLAPAVVLGALDVGGKILPVFNLRHRFRLPERALAPDDQFIIARCAGRRVVLVVDAAQGVADEPATPMVSSSTIAPELTHLQGVMSLPDGLVLIQDLERFLSAEEATALDAAIRSEEQRRAR